MSKHTTFKSTPAGRERTLYRKAQRKLKRSASQG